MVHSLGTVSNKAITTNVQALQQHIVSKPVAHTPRCDLAMPYVALISVVVLLLLFWFGGPSIQIYTKARPVYSSPDRMERFLLPTPSPPLWLFLFSRTLVLQGELLLYLTFP